MDKYEIHFHNFVSKKETQKLISSVLLNKVDSKHEHQISGSTPIVSRCSYIQEVIKLAFAYIEQFGNKIGCECT